MAVYKGRGIVLRSIRYGEADRILDLYTRDSGLVSTIAKGIRRTKSRFGGRLEPLSCVDFLAYEGRTLDTVTQVEVLRPFHKVREDLGRFEAAGGMVSTVRALIGGDEADRRVFNLLYHALDALEEREETQEGPEKDRGYGAVEAAFALKLSIPAGYAVRLDACVACERNPDEVPAEGPVHFAPPLGGVLCPDCCRSAGAVRDSFPLPPGALRTLRGLVARPIKEAAVPEGHAESVRRLVSSHVLAHAPGNATLAADRTPGLAPRHASRPA